MLGSFALAMLCVVEGGVAAATTVVATAAASAEAAEAATAPSDVIPTWRAALAGTAGGVIARTILAPLDKAAIMMQVQVRGGSSVLQIVQAEGLWSMWQGAGTNALRVGIFAGIVTMGYAHGLELKPSVTYDPFEPIWRGGIGAVASLVGTVVSHPLDVIRTRLTLQSAGKGKQMYRGIWDAARTIFAQEGYRGLCRGLQPACLSVVPEVFAQLVIYDVSVHYAKVLYGVEPSAPLFAMCGVLAGCASQVAVYPLDLVRRRMQQQGRQCVPTLREALVEVVRAGGPSALFNGVGPACARVGAAIGIAMVVRDTVLGRLSPEAVGQ